MAFLRYQIRRGTAAQWSAANPVLASGEMGFETDTSRFKLGNGSTAWSGLSYGGLVGPTGPAGPSFSPNVTSPITYDSGSTTFGFDRTLPVDTLAYSATVTLDMSALAGLYRTITLTGNLTLATSNRAAGRAVTLRLLPGASSRTLTFPAGWTFLGTAPTTLAANKTAILSVTFFGSADSDAVCAYAVQP